MKSATNSKSFVGSAPTSPSMGEVSFAQRTTEGVFALNLKKTPPKTHPETTAGLTPSVMLHMTAPPSRGSGRCGEDFP